MIGMIPKGVGGDGEDVDRVVNEIGTGPMVGANC